jgi:hypothetical protein
MDDKAGAEAHRAAAEATEDGGPSWSTPKMKVDAATAAEVTEDGGPSWPKPNAVDVDVDVDVAEATNNGAKVTEDGGLVWPKPKMKVDADAAREVTEDDGPSWLKPKDVAAANANGYGGDPDNGNHFFGG